MPRPVEGSAPYNAGLDGIRAIAVLGVIAYHLNFGWASGGLLGVGVFFVLSGYLITDLLIAALHKEGARSFGQFWLRRARRLLPALFLMLLVTVVWATLFSRAQLPALRTDMLPAVFYYSNWWYIFHHLSYFAQYGPSSPLGHLWSLAIEEQFYLVWPIVLLCALRWVRDRRVLFGGILLLAAGSATEMALLFVPYTDPTRVYDGTDTRAFELLIGAALALAWSRGRKFGPITARARTVLETAGALALGGIIALYCVTGQYDAFVYRGGMVLLSVLTAVLIAVCVHPHARVSHVLGVGPLRWIGERSYGMYLWSVPIIILSTPEGAGNNYLRDALQVLGIGVASALSWRYVEQPVRHGALGRALVRWRVAWGSWGSWGSSGSSPLSWRRGRGARGDVGAAAGGVGAGVAGAGGVAGAAGGVGAVAAAGDVEGAVAAASGVGAVAAAAAGDVRETASGWRASWRNWWLTSRSGRQPRHVRGRQLSGSVAGASGSVAVASGWSASGWAAAGLTLMALVVCGLGLSGVITGASPTQPVRNIVPGRHHVDPPGGGGRGGGGKKGGGTQSGGSTTTTGAGGTTTTTTTTVPAGQGVTVIGDSIMVDAAPYIEQMLPGAVVDAQISQQLTQVQAQVPQLKEDGDIGNRLILELGTNGYFSVTQLETLLRSLGPMKRIVLVNTRETRPWEQAVNQTIATVAKNYPHTTMVDWYDISANYPQYFDPDEVHLDPEGAQFYASLLVHALETS